MKKNKINRDISADALVEKLEKRIAPADLSNKGEQATFVKEVHKSEEFKLSQIPTPPALGRPSSVDAAHRFGKTSGST